MCCLTGAHMLKRRNKRMPVTTILTGDSQKLYERLMETKQYSEWFAYNEGASGWDWKWLKTKASQVLSPEAFEVLNDAALHCNRVLAIVDHPSGNLTLVRLAPDLRQAADESMARVLEQAVAIENYPEVKAPYLAAKKCVAELKELADRVETLGSQGQVGRDTVTSSSALQRVLEDLRFDSLAREELDQEQNN